MNRTSVFYSLAGTLPEKERKELLARITRSLSLKDRTDENIHPTLVAEDERLELMMQEMGQLGLWRRILLRIRRFLSGKRETDIFLSMKSSELLHRIRRRNAAVAIPEARLLTPELACRFYDLYVASHPLISIFQRLWHDTPFLEEMISYLLEQRIPQAKRHADELLSMEEMRQIYSRRERKEDLRKELLARLARYIGTIPDELFREFEEGILPFYVLKGVVLFPYRELFTVFEYRAGSNPSDGYPPFRNASAAPVLPYLDLIYYALYTMEKIKGPYRIHPELLRYYATNGKPERTDSEQEQEREAELVKDVKASLARIGTEVENFRTQVPLVELIRFYREDPYYRLMFYLPRLDLKEFYVSALRIRFLAELEGVFTDVRRSLIDEMTTKFFNNRAPAELSYYREYPGFDPRRMGLAYFSYLKSMPILYTFLIRNYRNVMQGSVEVLNSILTGRRRELQSRVILHAAALEELIDRIRQFDRSFSPDADDGKTFYRVRYTIESDLSQQRSYRTLLAQKDREARDILELGKDHIVGLQTAFREGLGLLHPERELRGVQSSDPHPFAGTLDGHLDEIDRFLKLLREVMEIETGR